MKKNFFAAAIVAASIATPAFAQSYIGVGVGSAQASNVDGTSSGITLSGGNTSNGSTKIYGGFQFTPNWGIEAQYSDLGNRNLAVSGFNVVVPIGSLKGSQYSIAGTGTLPLGANFSLLGKLGVSANRGTLNVNAPGITASASQNRTDLLIGVGVSYSITSKVAVRLEYEDFGKFSNNGGFNGGSIRVSNTSLNLQYAF